MLTYSRTLCDFITKCLNILERTPCSVPGAYTKKVISYVVFVRTADNPAGAFTTIGKFDALIHILLELKFDMSIQEYIFRCLESRRLLVRGKREIVETIRIEPFFIDTYCKINLYPAHSPIGHPF